MGFLKAGTPLRWPDSLKYIKHVREHGLEQFLHVYRAVIKRRADVLRWGDEIEYHLVRVDPETGLATIQVTAQAVLDALHAKDKETGRVGDAWKPEYGAWMVEGTPGFPYADDTRQLLLVEGNMLERRKYIKSVLGDDTHLYSMTAFPMFGRGVFSTPAITGPGGDASHTHYGNDALICGHPRFATLTRNIRLRRGSKVTIRVPIFRDSATVVTGGPNPDSITLFEDPVVDEAKTGDEGKTGDDGEGASGDVSGPKSDDTDGYVHLDAMMQGMGMCCLQVTFQARDLDESLRLYDQLAVLGPIMMALTAATPILKGRLTDHDVRWEVISALCDDRTPIERGVGTEPLAWEKLEHADETAGGRRRKLPKSRYASISSFVSESPIMKDKYNDVELPVDEATKEKLLKAGVPKRLANHVAHLFTRDPLVIFKEAVDVDDSKTTEHFENVQSTNWQSVRWKPPPPNADMGWRVELRTMETQFTDFENAAFAVFTALINRVILFFDLNMYMPMSLVDENMRRAHLRNATVEQKFHFRKFVSPLPETCPDDYGTEDPDTVEEMSMQDILTGKGRHFPGLIPLVMTYLDIISADAITKAHISHYLTFIEKRASGELLTPATWMRQFVRNHPEYKNDSVVSDRIGSDLLAEVRNIVEGRRKCHAMYGDFMQSRPAGVGKPTAPPTGDAASATDATGAAAAAAADGSTAGAATGADADVLTRTPARRLRGASFAEEAGASECFVIKQLVERYAITTSFKDTPAFLSMPPASSPPAFLEATSFDVSSPAAGAGGGAGAGADTNPSS